MFHYFSGVSLGVVGSVLLLVFILWRFIPKVVFFSLTDINTENKANSFPQILCHDQIENHCVAHTHHVLVHVLLCNKMVRVEFQRVRRVYTKLHIRLFYLERFSGAGLLLLSRSHIGHARHKHNRVGLKSDRSRIHLLRHIVSWNIYFDHNSVRHREFGLQTQTNRFIAVYQENQVPNEVYQMTLFL